MVSQLILVSNILAWLYGVSITFGSGEPIDFTSLGFGFSTKLLVLVSVHYVNEYTDYQTDLLTIRAVYSGGSGLLLKGIVLRKLIFQAAGITLIIGVCIQLSANYFGIPPGQRFLYLALALSAVDVFFVAT